MGLDFAAGCVNFRDVGECVNLIAGRDVFPVGRVLRGGKLEFVTGPEQIGDPGSIFNFRRGPDPDDRRFGADHWQFAIPNEHENYDTADPAVRRWLNDVLACLAGEVTRFPVLLHCTSGKDRTGVAVAALLAACGVERGLIVEEYLWSEGGVDRVWIEAALDGLGDPTAYFRRVDLGQLRAKVAAPTPGRP